MSIIDGYVIYCRKSTDESTEKQAASIPSQIEACINYAKNKDLLIAQKPDNIPEVFESQRELDKEDSSDNENDRHLYKATRGLYIIKESKSAKTPKNRPKWTHLIQLIRRGEIKGLLSYSPDRQARNMLEGGEIIDCVDQEEIDLQYTNFLFEPTASGKMMLGIWFVFSKQYSDNLSEVIARGNSKAMADGTTLGDFKHGYVRGEDDKWKPDGKNFELLQQAFYKKIESDISNKKLSELLNHQGYSKPFGKNDDPIQLNQKKLSEIFRDSFYYGYWKRGKEVIDLRKVDPHFIPMITEDQFQILEERYIARTKTRSYGKNNALDSIRAIDNGILIDMDKNPYTLYLPNSKRHKEKLKDGMTLGDVVKPHQIYFKHPKHNESIRFDVIDSKIAELLTKFAISKEHYSDYVEYAKKRLKDESSASQEHRNGCQLQINNLRQKLNNFVANNMHKNRDEVEEEIYRTKRATLTSRIKYYEDEFNKVNIKEDDLILEMETVLHFFQKADEYYKKANYVQKAKIIKLLCSNVVVKRKNSVTLRLNAGVEELFTGLVEMAGVEPASK